MVVHHCRPGLSASNDEDVAVAAVVVDGDDDAGGEACVDDNAAAGEAAADVDAGAATAGVAGTVEEEGEVEGEEVGAGGDARDNA